MDDIRKAVRINLNAADQFSSADCCLPLKTIQIRATRLRKLQFNLTIHYFQLSMSNYCSYLDTYRSNGFQLQSIKKDLCSTLNTTLLEDCFCAVCLVPSGEILIGNERRKKCPRNTSPPVHRLFYTEIRSLITNWNEYCSPLTFVIDRSQLN